MIYLFVIGHIVLGLYFVRSGFMHFKNLKMLEGYTKSKNVLYPKYAVIGTGILLLIGGIGITLWVYPKLALFCIAVFLIFTTYMMHQFWKVTDPMARMGEQVNFYKNIALLASVFIMLGSL